MQFGIEKCATVKFQKGKMTDTKGIALANAQVIQDNCYQYLGILVTVFGKFAPMYVIGHCLDPKSTSLRDSA